MKTELTERQKAILSFIEEYISQNGYPPTLREIGGKFNISSTFGVKRHLDALEKKGYLSIESKASRGINVKNIRESKLTSLSGEEAIELPIVGRVAAGYPILAVENIEGNVIIDRRMMKHAEGSFSLKVRGDSMINAGIFDGDLLIVTQTTEVSNGEIIIALLGDEATCKRFMNKNGKILLLPENDNYKPIEVKDRESFSVIGKVTGVLRWYN